MQNVCSIGDGTKYQDRARDDYTEPYTGVRPEDYLDFGQAQVMVIIMFCRFIHVKIPNAPDGSPAYRAELKDISGIHPG